MYLYLLGDSEHWYIKNLIIQINDFQGQTELENRILFSHPKNRNQNF